MILIDSNVPMYVVGTSHPNKIQAHRLLERALLDRQRLVTDAEVFQEILHRYTALNRREIIQPAFDALLGFVDHVFAVDQETVEQAKQIVLAYPRFSARDAVHVAVMRQHGIDQVLSFDAGLDQVQGIKRLF